MKRPTPMTTVSTNTPIPEWWHSADGKRGFCLSAVKGFDYRPASAGQMASTVYLYLDGGIAHYTGAEADTVFALVKGKGKA